MSTSAPTIPASSSVEPLAPAAGLDEEEALELLLSAESSSEGHAALLRRARETRERFLPDGQVAFCGILQAKLGGCQEDCAFCVQSRHHRGSVPPRPLASEQEILERAGQVAAMGARAFSVVTAGRRLKEGPELDRLCRVVERVRSEIGLECCASLGRLDEVALRRLRSAGLQRYHHNLEAAPSRFGELITTYRQAESLETLEAARGAGLTLCASGIFGAGETSEQRVELIGLLRTLGVEGAPLCFLEPHPGTPLGDQPLIDLDEALRVIAVHRLMLPAADVIVTGGRLLVLGDRQGEALDAGANAVMVGDYPTSFGGELERDQEMVRQRGMSPRPPRLR